MLGWFIVMAFLRYLENVAKLEEDWE